MNIENGAKYHVAVIGAGPAGIYAAQRLVEENVRVSLFNRDIKPGGLAEYGIYHSKYKMKEGLRKQFRQVLESPDIDYYGNVTVGQEGDLTLDDLRRLGFQAILVTVGAQGTKWLGLPGEDLQGVYHAKDIVYHYNKLPPFSQQQFFIGRRAALIGVGNVMIDVAHWLVRDLKIDEVIAVARRGPAEVKFTKKEMENVVWNLDAEALEAEIARVTPVMKAVEQDPEAAKDFILSALRKGQEPVSETRLRFQFLTSPSRILGDGQGRVCGLEVEDTTLTPFNGDTKAKRLGSYRVLDVDTVVFCIGDRVDETFGLPVKWNEYVKNPAPRFPVNDTSYEAYDPAAERPIEGVFVAGWARKASDGLVGIARKDGVQGSEAMVQYLQALYQPLTAAELESHTQQLDQRLQQLNKPVIAKADWQRLERLEQARADELDLEEFKFSSNEEMLAAVGMESQERSPLAVA